MARAAIEDPLKVFRFRVKIDGFVRMGFQEVSGLERDTDEANYAEGGAETDEKSAGRTKYTNITFKRGQIIGGVKGGDDDIEKWAEAVHNPIKSGGTLENYRKDVTIEQYNSMNQLARKWEVSNMWPKRWKAMSDMNAMGSDNSIEEMECPNEGWHRVKT